MANARRIHKISRVRTIGGRRKAFRNIFRKSRSLIGKGYRKVAGKKILKKMSAKERKRFNPKTNLKIRQSLRKRKIKQRLINYWNLLFLKKEEENLNPKLKVMKKKYQRNGVGNRIL